MKLEIVVTLLIVVLGSVYIEERDTFNWNIQEHVKRRRLLSGFNCLLSLSDKRETSKKIVYKFLLSLYLQ